MLNDIERNGHCAAAQWREVVDHFNTWQLRVLRAFSAIKLHKFIHAHAASLEAL